jgi:predicted nucleic acid-binding protein
VVIDASPLLAVLFNEKFGPWVLDQLQAYALAKDEGSSVLTLDRDFRRLDVTVIRPRQ